MTTYTAIGAGEVVAGQPVKESLMQRLAFNVLAIIEGDPSAPNISPAALDWECDLIMYDTPTGGNVTDLGAGAKTWTAPGSATQVAVVAVGGGGGGGNGGTGAPNGQAGGNTTFDPGGGAEILGAGGLGGTGGDAGNQPRLGGVGGSGGVATTQIDGQAGGNGINSVGGGHGGRAFPDLDSGQGGWPPSPTTGNDAQPGRAFGGGGGGGAETGTNGEQGGGGGGGQFGRKTYTVVPTVGYAVQIGKGGDGGGAGGGTLGGRGGDGAVNSNYDGEGSTFTGFNNAPGGGGAAGYMMIMWRA